ncbi:hypothetical protein NDU88_004573 [Pleurodeles waltl]|uniref:Uncharacterized protein n=1 Tax=Pleurodeles waltl TaxID=8319 RepID=A0AAV7M7I4_PLEWA|nr:hypothetical protein NDU88_004573 [Pleurodeles waltl]
MWMLYSAPGPCTLQVSHVVGDCQLLMHRVHQNDAKSGFICEALWTIYSAPGPPHTPGVPCSGRLSAIKAPDGAKMMKEAAPVRRHCGRCSRLRAPRTLQVSRAVGDC